MPLHNSKLVAKNTAFLYFRTMVVMAISIYTSRIILNALGVDDYGVYNVIGGFVAMFSILSASLVNASQRFISFEMGKEHPQMKRLFCGTVTIHLLLAIAVLIVFETFGLWFLNAKLNICPERIPAANWVFQCSVLTFCINLISVPYNASIIAHERMSIFAYISIYEAIAKLVIVYLLNVIGYDKLIVYAFMMLSIAVSLRLIYGIYCSRHFEECKYRFVIDKPLFKEMLGFTGWNFIGSTAGILMSQGINILINIFFGVALNAARGLAEQANQAINTFVNNFMTAINPQITKSYAAGDYEYMNKLMARGAKYAALLFWFIALVFFIEADIILEIWLVEVPLYAPIFLRLTILCSVFQALSSTLYIGMLATGNIKKYQIVMGSIYMGSFILCYVLFKLGLGPEFGYISTLIALLIALFVRLQLIREIVSEFSVKAFFNQAILKSTFVILLSTGVVYLIKHFLVFSNQYTELAIVLLLSMFSVSVISLLIALSKSEKDMLQTQLVKIIKSSKHQ